MANHAAVVELDQALATKTMGESDLRLYLGALLEAVARRGIHHELGFSSFEAYALESCQRSPRWALEARQVARARERLPQLARAIAVGDVSWTMAVLVASRATVEDESPWLIAARELTVRQVRALTFERRPEPGALCDGVSMMVAHDAIGCDEPDSERSAERLEETRSAAKPSACRLDEVSYSADASAWRLGEVSSTVDAGLRELRVTVPIEDAWLFEATKMLVRRISGATGTDAVLEALLAEGESSLVDEPTRDADDEPTLEAIEAGQRAWERQREAWREEAEKRCERRVSSAPVPEERRVEIPDAVSLEAMPTLELHDRVRRAGRALAALDLEVGRLAEEFFAADGWRRLGYATARQYTRERLGLGLSTIKERRALARRSARLPLIVEAIEAGAIGAEAARLVSTVAIPDSSAAWVARAMRRTVKHLREEVAAARLVAFLDGRDAPTPPSVDELAAVHSAETAVISGAIFRGAEDGVRASAEDGVRASAEDGVRASRMSAAGRAGATSVEDDGAAGATDGARAGRMSAAGQAMRDALLAALSSERPIHAGHRSRPTATLRFRVTVETYDAYRRLRRIHRRRLRGESFLRFLCLSLIEAWKHVLPPTMAYGEVYARDRFQCVSPVCSRRDVTPHHLRYRAHGGDDSDENVASLCTWCHLEGVHGGRLRAEPPAGAIHWQIGRTGHMIVDGRDLIAG